LAHSPNWPNLDEKVTVKAAHYCARFYSGCPARRGNCGQTQPREWACALYSYGRVSIRLGKRSSGPPRDRSDGVSRGIDGVSRPRKQTSLPFHQGLLAEVEAEGDALRALTRIDEAFALVLQTRQDNTGATRSCTACVARFCSSAIPRIRRPPRRHSSRQSLSLKRRRRAVSSCLQLSIWRDFIISLAAPRMLTPCSRLRSRAFRRLQNSPRSKRRERCSPR
jgi:hypothetical protein